ncbi:MAG TPA: PBP1A family penicillin-binding protein, partial [Caulobacteraceae bacterium]|nr:PBP1A family penicillin-binding protein [Caulobacteraceae bacterium]
MIAALAMGLTAELPSLPPIRREPQITYLDRSGAVIGVRGGRYGPPVNIDRLPAYVPAAFVAIEDRRFYSHAGIDPVGMARALVADLTSGRTAQGGSTITQQLARNLYLSNDQTLERKGQELIYAAELERVYSKKQILGLYLSRIYFGSGAYGIEAAAHRYFNKPAERLTLREAAMLAAVPKSPTAYDPAEQPTRSAERTALVLSAMVDTGAITQTQRARALAHPAKVWPSEEASAGQYFIDWIDGPVRKTLGAARADAIVDTTLDLPAERAAGEAVKTVVGRFAHAGAGQAAVVSMDAIGRVRVLVGGLDHDSGPYDRAVSAHRQAGSSWKPFVYLAAMEAGRTPDTMAVDEPVTIAGWSPRDFEPEFMGPVTLQVALAHSLNTVAARLADEIGRQNVVAAAHRVGILSPIGTEPAMALGAELVAPLEMAQAYDAFSNGGARVSAYGIERIRTVSGRLIFAHRGPAPQPAIANPALSEMNQMLRTVITAGTGARAAIPGYDLAGKTGTTSDFRDAWFCGFTGGLTTVVWMGRDDNAPMRGITGGSAPAELWRMVMRTALPRLPHGPIPAGAPAPAPVVPVAQP